MAISIRKAARQLGATRKELSDWLKKSGYLDQYEAVCGKYEDSGFFASRSTCFFWKSGAEYEGTYSYITAAGLKEIKNNWGMK